MKFFVEEDDLLKEAMQYLQGIMPATMNQGKPGFVLSDRTLNQYDKREELPDVVAVSTLSALVALVKAKVNLVEARLAVHVVDHTVVKVIELASDAYGRRAVHVVAKLPELAGFKFGTWHDHESFVISVMANFTATPDREYLLGLASKLTAEHAAESTDDGIAQKVVVRKGAAVKTTETVKLRLQLAPFRTFREVTQPISEFIFRVHQEEGEMPTLALFEADGGKWRIDAAAAVRDWFAGKLDQAIPIVA